MKQRRQCGRGWWVVILAWAMFGLLACDAGGSKAPPTGTPTDPVETCVSVGQVCRFQGQQLGVCQFREGTDTAAATRFVCVSQH